jgi:hypothetical protein
MTNTARRVPAAEANGTHRSPGYGWSINGTGAFEIIILPGRKVYFSAFPQIQQ